MMLRQRLVPKNFMDFGAVTFILVMIQVIYWFELFLVLPEHYTDGGMPYYIHCAIGTWLLFNVVGNYVIVFFLDTSIRGRFLSSEMKPNWRFCDVCEAVAPPRSWHCPVCDVCILKRDHHCNFTACCIGHENQRYFMMFLLHLSISTIYASYFNAIFLWKCTTFSVMGVLKLMFPIALFMFGGDTSQTQLYRLFCVIAFIGMIAAISLGCYHTANVLNGQVMHERVKGFIDYDLGRKENIRQVFGERWYITWISPFVNSPLPSDGIEWVSVKKTSAKSK